MDRQMAMQMAAEMGMDWATLEAEAEWTGTPAMCAVCMEAAERAMEAGTTPPPACPGCPMEDDDPTPAPTGAEGQLGWALEGARLALAHWLAEGDAELARDAQGRLERLQMAARGETPEWWTAHPDARSADVDGALDWLDTSPRPDLEAVAIAGLMAAWDAMVDEGEMDETELAQSLAEQADSGCQGWDSSIEDAEAHPELAALVGLDMGADPDDPDEMEDRWEAWGRVVGEAARRWLEQHGLAKEDQHEVALAAWRRADAMAEELYAVGLEELADKMWEMGQAARQVAADLEKAMGFHCTV